MDSKVISDRLIHDVRNPLNNISINAELGKLTLERTGDIARAIRIFEVILLECRACSTRLDAFKSTNGPDEAGR
ncbi:histidine kinase [Cellvibrio sp. KY-GH-1]|uniref:histidine kinase n=1 Tax=Cellvibrio sp. KY-GH-1 TaxID=2303332 RepID=UPI001243D13D|nr:histidine kinase [Cellvibrio sp. KY-GH-1]QEY15597.1 histidine kinase [Cellvibrio sp. KY-GH-1]